MSAEARSRGRGSSWRRCWSGWSRARCGSIAAAATRCRVPFPAPRSRPVPRGGIANRSESMRSAGALRDDRRTGAASKLDGETLATLFTAIGPLPSSGFAANLPLRPTGKGRIGNIRNGQILHNMTQRFVDGDVVGTGPADQALQQHLAYFAKNVMFSHFLAVDRASQFGGLAQSVATRVDKAARHHDQIIGDFARFGGARSLQSKLVERHFSGILSQVSERVSLHCEAFFSSAACGA